MPPEFVLFIGLQASGKSSFYRSKFAISHVHMSKDLLRNNSNPERRQRQLITEALAQGQSVAVDNTNATAANREALIELARSAGVRVVGYYFESRVKECLERNQQREGKERVPDVALYATIKRLERPRRAEGFDALYHVRLAPGGGFQVSDWRDEDKADEAQ